MIGKFYTLEDLPQDLVKEQIEELLSPGYGDIEMGRKEFEGGVMSCFFCRMLNCTSEMLEWWYREYLTDTAAYKLWSPEHEYLSWENKKPGEYIGATEIHQENGVKKNTYFMDPTLVFDPERMKEMNIHHAMYCTCNHLEVEGRGTITLTIARDTAAGCEVRSRCFKVGAKIDGKKANYNHGIIEIYDMESYLPVLYARRAKACK